MNYTKIERERYNQDRNITCKRLDITENQYNWLRRKGNELHKIYEENCNGYIEEDLYFRRCKEIERLIEQYIAPKGLFVFYQTDPRGATIYVDKKPIPENNYNQAECIY